jgi:methionyl-tRNA formyltransferase
MTGRLIFLGYNREQTRLIGFIEKRGWQVSQTEDRITDLSGYDLAISFGYRHILTRQTLLTARRRVLNLHIAYLPWNRGRHPLFWAMYDGTPTGVTIHEIDTGVDTGAICVQKHVAIDADTETFASGYRRLLDEIEMLFEAHADALLSGHYTTRAQEGAGTSRKGSELPAGFSWDETIAPAMRRLKQGRHD